MKGLIKELNHVAVHVEDVARSSRFYAEVLQLPTLPRPAFDFPGAWFALGPNGQQLHLIGNRDLPVYSNSRGTHFALQVEQIEKVEQHLRSQHVEFMGPRPRPDGATQIFIQDPDGHWIELCEIKVNP